MYICIYIHVYIHVSNNWGGKRPAVKAVTASSYVREKE